MQETRVPFLGLEDPLEKEMATSNTTVQKHQFFGPQPSSQFMKYQIGEVAVKILSDRKVSDNFPQ